MIAVDEISTGTLRDIVKDEEAMGQRSIAVPKLLHRLGLDNPLEGIRGGVAAAKLTVEIDRPSERP
jgi:hypothetical protein